MGVGEKSVTACHQRDLAEASFADSLEAVDQLLAEVAERDLAETPLMEQVRRNLLRKASGFFERFLGQRGDDPTVREQAGRVYSRLGDIHELLNEDEEAERAYNQALTLLRRRVQEAPAATAARRELARALNQQGVLFKKWGRYGAAETALREALQLARTTGRPQSPGRPSRPGGNRLLPGGPAGAAQGPGIRGR